MRAFNRRKRRLSGEVTVHQENPLSGVANLFDASIVFAVGVMVALIQAFSFAQMLGPDSDFTLIRKDAATGQVEIVEKNAREITVRRMTDERKGGSGVRLGVAYRLPDGTVVYVPDDPAASQ
jgi:hypothetical protein